MNNLNIQYRDPKVLKAYPGNANTHPSKQIAAIRRSIQKFGFLVPVLVDDKDMLICGHGRVEAAIELELQEIPVMSVSHLSEAEKRVFIIADNKITEGSVWDHKQLAIEFEGILDLGDEIEIIETSFELPEIDFILDQAADRPKDDIDDQPVDMAHVEHVSRRGDLWLLGRHRLFCGDALDSLSYQVLLDDEKAQMIFTDPPYNCPIKGHVSGLGKAQHREFEMASGEMSEDEFAGFLRSSCQQISDYSIDGAIIYICMDWRQLNLLQQAGGDVFEELKALCVWDKQTGGMGSLYRSQHELIAVYKSGTQPHINNIRLGRYGRNRTNVWSYQGMSGFSKDRDKKLALHPTVKNTSLVGDAILDCSLPGGLILDPFAGSGTLALAAQRTNRRAAMIELDPHYCDVILRRFCDATGIEPVNAATGEVVRKRDIEDREAANG